MRPKPISPIRNNRGYRAAIDEIEALWDAKPGTPEHDRLEVLGTLVDAYESRRWPIEAPDPVEAIKFRMEQGGLKPAPTRNRRAASHPPRT
jgi:HTH-type transcriptional regulator/antitoxin HigA